MVDPLSSKPPAAAHSGTRLRAGLASRFRSRAAQSLDRKPLHLGSPAFSGAKLGRLRPRRHVPRIHQPSIRGPATKARLIVFLSASSIVPLIESKTPCDGDTVLIESERFGFPFWRWPKKDEAAN